MMLYDSILEELYKIVASKNDTGNVKNCFLPYPYKSALILGDKDCTAHFTEMMSFSSVFGVSR
jgi:hypothetical protein